MNTLLWWAYRAAGEVATLAARVVPAGEGKVTRALVARREVRGRFAAWGRTGRDRTRPLLWMHAPSVGEGLQARPVLELVRSRLPHVQLAYTFFSPSAEPFARGLAVDFADYLPFDTVGGAHAALDALQPTALVYAKLDVWPILTAEGSGADRLVRALEALCVVAERHMALLMAVRSQSDG
ncbi:MAG: glycosyltransferase N-terminal domain-containing protein, partial [Gemmatimonadota bacterium]